MFGSTFKDITYSKFLLFQTIFHGVRIFSHGKLTPEMHLKIKKTNPNHINGINAAISNYEILKYINRTHESQI